MLLPESFTGAEGKEYLEKQAPYGSLRWREIPAPGDWDPGRLKHFWNKWMHVFGFLGTGLSQFGC